MLMVDLLFERMKLFFLLFLVIGVDFFGFFNFKYGRNKFIKVWGVLFICVIVRVIYLEIVENFFVEVFL